MVNETPIPGAVIQAEELRAREVLGEPQTRRVSQLMAQYLSPGQAFCDCGSSYIFVEFGDELATGQVEVRCHDIIAYRNALRLAFSAPPPLEGEVDELREAIEAAYRQGAHDVHENWEPDPDPSFLEAGSDYAASLDLDAIARAAIAATSQRSPDGVREALRNARYALEYWDREVSVRYRDGIPRTLQGPLARGREEIARLLALAKPQDTASDQDEGR